MSKPQPTPAEISDGIPGDDLDRFLEIIWGALHTDDYDPDYSELRDSIQFEDADGVYEVLIRKIPRKD
jgi:hypothetical protein